MLSFLVKPKSHYTIFPQHMWQFTDRKEKESMESDDRHHHKGTWHLKKQKTGENLLVA